MIQKCASMIKKVPENEKRCKKVHEGLRIQRFPYRFSGVCIYCQAQSQLQLNWTELVLLSIYPILQPAGRPASQPE